MSLRRCVHDPLGGSFCAFVSGFPNNQNAKCCSAIMWFCELEDCFYFLIGSALFSLTVTHDGGSEL